MWLLRAAEKRISQFWKEQMKNRLCVKSFFEGYFRGRRSVCCSYYGTLRYDTHEVREISMKTEPKNPLQMTKVGCVLFAPIKEFSKHDNPLVKTRPKAEKCWRVVYARQCLFLHPSVSVNVFTYDYEKGDRHRARPKRMLHILSEIEIKWFFTIDEHQRRRKKKNCKKKEKMKMKSTTISFMCCQCTQRRAEKRGKKVSFKVFAFRVSETLWWTHLPPSPQSPPLFCLIVSSQSFSFASTHTLLPLFSVRAHGISPPKP